MPEAQGTRTRSTRQAAAILAVLSAAPCFSSAREVHNAVRRHIELSLLAAQPLAAADAARVGCARHTRLPAGLGRLLSQ
jgi:hypothetical protein